MDFFRIKYDKSYFQNLWTRTIRNSQRNRMRLQEILKHRRKGRLLEIGCGEGGFLSQAQSHFDVYGVDISDYAIEAIRPKFGHRVRQLDISRGTLATHKYEVIAAFNILEHLVDPRIAVDKIYAALKSQGMLIGSVPNNTPLIGAFHTWLTNTFDRTHRSTFVPERWHKIFNQAGFQDIHFYGELMLGSNTCFYVRKPGWSHLAFNMMFLCVK